MHGARVDHRLTTPPHSTSPSQYHYNPLILRRHPDTGALSAESWPLCYNCVTRRRIDEFVAGKRVCFGGFTVTCATCLAPKREAHELEAAKAKPMATAAIKKFDADADDAETAVNAKAAKLVADHWGEQTCTTAEEACDWGWHLAGDEDRVLQEATAEAAAALFEEEEETKNGGGSAEG